MFDVKRQGDAPSVNFCSPRQKGLHMKVNFNYPRLQRRYLNVFDTFIPKYDLRVCAGIDRFQAIKTDVLLIFSFITCDKTEFLSPMMFSNEYITGI